ncbi:porin [Pseudoalteromonas ostreae]|uniref:porin n=1 Tax=Pseudoalteromonas ostreae TaxID=2774154 RepID=UPI001B387FBA|nr:porin [Pseudoalteromonas ostreae]
MQKKIICFLLTTSYAAAVCAQDEQEELQNLKLQLGKISTQLATLESLTVKFESISKRIEILENKNHPSPIASTLAVANSAPDLKPEELLSDKFKKDIKIYATIRPTFGYVDENSESQWDVRDALSHVGIKSTAAFDDYWQATLHGEWGVDLSNNGDFGKARQVYVALDSPYGKVGIGKQRPAQYLFIAEYVDIFNHGNSPFAYDPESLFFVNNLLTYQVAQGDFTWMLVSQFDGSSGDNNSDLVNGGVSYDKDNLHLALTYTNQGIYENEQELGDDNIIGSSFAYSFDSGLYFALGYQFKEYNRDFNADRDGHTFDLSMAYPLSESYKVKLGYFDFDDGHQAEQSQKFNGTNLTLEWLPAENLRLHVEYLYRNFNYLADFSSLSVGFRYDYSQEWGY